MRIDRIELRNFKKFERATFEFPRPVNGPADAWIVSRPDRRERHGKDEHSRRRGGGARGLAGEGARFAVGQQLSPSDEERQAADRHATRGPNAAPTSARHHVGVGHGFHSGSSRGFMGAITTGRENQSQ